MNFVQREYSFTYVAWGDIMSAIGGINAFLTPIVAQFMPFFVLWFLFELGKIIHDQYKEAYRKELFNFIKLTYIKMNT